jgi:hypothetical protein
VFHDVPDDELGKLNHQSAKLGIFFHERVDVGLVKIGPQRRRSAVLILIAWLVMARRRGMWLSHELISLTWPAVPELSLHHFPVQRTDLSRLV